MGDDTREPRKDTETRENSPAIRGVGARCGRIRGRARLRRRRPCDSAVRARIRGVELRRVGDRQRLRAHATRLCAPRGPVSYTHLDVYKRQEIHCEEWHFIDDHSEEPARFRQQIRAPRGDAGEECAPGRNRHRNDVSEWHCRVRFIAYGLSLIHI